ncbi:hypothetical protein [Rhizobium etli]|uniref:hypothetical protein n=1 Tax=Rhizobium etli TaxID=29449 RepID=UPI00059FEB96|nr:hypothetical protein [Rhizobium etli]
MSWVILGTAWEWSKSVLAVLSLAGLSMGGVAYAAYALFKVLGEKWLNQKFAERLEAYKSEQARELERLRHKINSVFDRTKRLHDREYEVLPEVWSLLVDAKSWAGGYLSAFRQYADVNKLSAQELDEFLSHTRFSEAQRREIKTTSDKQKAYIKIFEMYRHYDVIEKLQEASIGLSRNGIFVVPSLREEMRKFIDLLHSAVIEHQINQEQDLRPRMREASKKLKQEGEPLFKAIEEAVAARLWDSTTAEV